MATPVALSAFQKESAGKGRKASEALAAIFRMDKVISLDVIKNAFAVIESQKSESVVDSHEGDPEADEINKLVQERTDAKKGKDLNWKNKRRLRWKGLTTQPILPIFGRFTTRLSNSSLRFHGEW